MTTGGLANDIDYQADGTLHRITHANGVLETVSINPADGLQRPTSIATSAGWSTGAFDYDGGGNIKKMGAQDFTYDRLSRLTLGEAATGGLEAITYDSFGNIQSMNTGGVFQSTPTSATNNRLTLTGTTYDPAGNLSSLTLDGETFEYEYDGLSMMRSLVSNTDQAKVFLYSGLLSWADDERFAVFECVSGFGPYTCALGEQHTLWYMRDLDGKVLRSWEQQIELDYLGTPR